ncbi:MAG: DNA translocase FtsK 4TM domain-containing protein [Chloroflexi bacterium]|nr:DNA translocase FtsK 4TM domain-containing protein [Chloroflexota bacterium]
MNTPPATRVRTEPVVVDVDTHPIRVVDDQAERRGAWLEEASATVAVLLGLLAAVAVFVPADGRLSLVLHDEAERLLGHGSFLVPATLLIAGVLVLVHRFAPDVTLPLRRLVGLALVVLAALPAMQMLSPSGAGTGLVGAWLATSLLDWLGAPVTTLMLLALIVLGGLLAVELSVSDLLDRVRRARLPVVHPDLADDDEPDELALPDRPAPDAR